MFLIKKRVIFVIILFLTYSTLEKFKSKIFIKHRDIETLSKYLTTIAVLEKPLNKKNVLEKILKSFFVLESWKMFERI